MVKWFDKWFAKKCREAWDNAQKQEYDCVVPAALTIGSSRSLESRSLTITVYHAQGGTVIETRNYDEKTDRNNTKLYVIHDDQNLGKELDHIITLEALRQ